MFQNFLKKYILKAKFFALNYFKDNRKELTFDELELLEVRKKLLICIWISIASVAMVALSD